MRAGAEGARPPGRGCAPATFAVVSERKDGTYLLPIGTQFECSGSRTASNRCYGEISRGSSSRSPDRRTTTRRCTCSPSGSASRSRCSKHIQVDGDAPLAEDILREINRGTWSIGYTGQSPERLKQHMEQQGDFDMVSLRGKPGTTVEGEFYGLPWPCWGTPELKHPGTHVLYNTHEHVMKGGVPRPVRRRARRRDAALAEGSWSVSSEIEDGYPEFTWHPQDARLRRRPDRRRAGEHPGGRRRGCGRASLGHRSLRRHPAGRDGARLRARWQQAAWSPGTCRTVWCIASDLQPAAGTRGRVPDDRGQARFPRDEDIGHTLQAKAVADKIGQILPPHPDLEAAGRVRGRRRGDAVEPVAGRAAARRCSSRSTRRTRPGSVSGRRHGLGLRPVRGQGPGQGAGHQPGRRGGVAFMPFHFSGYWEGESQRAKYPEGADPIVLGDSANACTTYGYDPVTAMHEGKATLCRIEAA
ncbi:MAG: hypothetical protein R3D25_01950 [Geminicoccaceae bacterium]